jgi:hypothetical protein
MISGYRIRINEFWTCEAKRVLGGNRDQGPAKELVRNPSEFVRIGQIWAVLGRLKICM